MKAGLSGGLRPLWPGQKAQSGIRQLSFGQYYIKTTIKTYQIGKLCKPMKKTLLNVIVVMRKGPSGPDKCGLGPVKKFFWFVFLKQFVENLFFFSMLFTELKKNFFWLRKMNSSEEGTN